MFAYFVCEAQTYPIPSNIGGPTTLVKTPNYGGLQAGLIPFSFADTTAANAALTYGKNYNGFLIYTQTPQATWWRLADSSKWVMILPQGGGTPISGQAWINPGNSNLFTDASLNGGFGTLGNNGVYFKTNGITRLYLDRNGIAPETGTSVGIGIDPADSNRVTYFSGGGGATPTWQQTLNATNGKILTSNNVIETQGYNLWFNNIDSYIWLNSDQVALKAKRPNSDNSVIMYLDHTSVGPYYAFEVNQDTTGSQVVVQGTANNLNTSITHYAQHSGARTDFNIWADSIALLPHLGKIYIDTIRSGTMTNRLVGWTQGTSDNGKLGYITIGSGLSLSSGVLSATSIATPTWQQTLTAGSTLNTNNTISMGNTSFIWSGVVGSSLEATIGQFSLETLQEGVAFSPYTGQFLIDTLNNETFQNQLMGWTSTSGTNRGKVGYITIGTGLSLSSGVLSSTVTAGANTALSNLASVAINTSLLPGTDDGAALGSTSKEFSDLFLASGGVINWANGNTTLTQTSGSLTLGGAFYATSSVAAGTYLYGGDKYNTYTGYTGAVLGGITTHAVLDFVDNNSRIGEFYTDASNFNFFTDVSKGIVFYVNNSFTAPALQFSSAGALRLGYLGAGALTADASGNITSVSDERLKNIEGGYGVGLSQVYKINPIVYKWKPETKLDSLNSYIGFSAQNIEYALGENAVGINRDGYKSIQDRAILAALTNSIKELKDLNDSQQKEIDDLKKEVKELKRL